MMMNAQPHIRIYRALDISFCVFHLLSIEQTSKYVKIEDFNVWKKRNLDKLNKCWNLLNVKLIRMQIKTIWIDCFGGCAS